MLVRSALRRALLSVQMVQLGSKRLSAGGQRSDGLNLLRRTQRRALARYLRLFAPIEMNRRTAIPIAPVPSSRRLAGSGVGKKE